MRGCDWLESWLSKKDQSCDVSERTVFLCRHRMRSGGAAAWLTPREGKWVLAGTRGFGWVLGCLGRGGCAMGVLADRWLERGVSRDPLLHSRDGDGAVACLFVWALRCVARVEGRTGLCPTVACERDEGEEGVAECTSDMASQIWCW
jgi:hypothetical protein